MDDGRIWDYARRESFAIVSKDYDFRERSYLEGAPPKVVWLDVGNAGTKAIEELLRRERTRPESFGVSIEDTVLILSLSAKTI
jgi:predicted nuclease of predicted toxin-antitoxin system